MLVCACVQVIEKTAQLRALQQEQEIASDPAPATATTTSTPAGTSDNAAAEDDDDHPYVALLREREGKRWNGGVLLDEAVGSPRPGLRGCWGSRLRISRQTTQEYLTKITIATRGPHTKMSSLRLLNDLKTLRRIEPAVHVRCCCLV